MLNFTQMLSPDFRRRSHNQKTDALRFKKPDGLFPPVIVWNITYRCNLSCIHCYASSGSDKISGELNLEESLQVIDQLAEAGITYLIFSGGDPLYSPNFFKLAEAANQAGIPISISTNGTLINKKETAKKLKAVGIDYVGISLDGIGDRNDRIRGEEGAYRKALAGARYCRDEGIKVGLRMTLMQSTLDQIDGLFDLVREEEFSRLYFSHLVFSGRGEELKDNELTPQDTRQFVERVFNQAEQGIQAGDKMEIVTGSNDTDGVYLYLLLKKANDPRAESVLKKLQRRGGNTSGEKIFNIDNVGNIYPDQFWRTYPLGNLKEDRFVDIWKDNPPELVRNLRERDALLLGRCQQCCYKEICRGNTRARAEFVTGEKWGSDPACYLTDEEIGL